VVPSTFRTDWSLAPEVLLPLAAVLALGLRPGTSFRRRTLLLSGWMLLALALVSPLCRLAAATASGHMAQHAILVALAPPLLVLGLHGARKERVQPLGMAAVSALYAAAIWLAHAPLIYEVALADPVAHLLTLGLLAGAGAMFWDHVLRRARAGDAILALFLAMLHTGMLGALLTFAPQPWYPVFAGRTEPWGLSPLEDQQLAGLLMCVPMSGVYLGVAIAMLGRALGGLAAAPPGPMAHPDQRSW
jgi:putative membrane protein